MKLNIKNINIWLQGLDEKNQLCLWANNALTLADDYALPKPQYYPKAQLRRLSPFSKIALHCLDIPRALSENLPLVFASQHGDLAKTVKLIKDVAVDEELSPTQFALSVHNATTGLFGIATKNTAATTTISAGKNTFIEGLIEAAMQSQQENTAIIYTYCDFDVPEEYQQFEARNPARCITMIISNKANEDDKVTINVSLKQQTNLAGNPLSSDLAIDFIRNYYLKSPSTFESNNYALSLAFPA